MKFKSYAVYYHKLGFFDQCWGSPSVRVKARSIDEARRRGYKLIVQQVGPHFRITGCAVLKNLKMPKKGYFSSIVAPIFKKDISKLRNYNYDIRQILSDNAIKVTKLKLGPFL